MTKSGCMLNLAAQSVEDRIAYHRKLLGAKAEEFTQHDDRIRLLMDNNGDEVADTATILCRQVQSLGRWHWCWCARAQW